MGNYLSFLCSSLLASYAKNKNVFSFKYYFAGNCLLKVNNKDIKICCSSILFVDFEQVCGHVANILYSLRNLNTCSQIKSNEKNLGPNLFQTTVQKMKFSIKDFFSKWKTSFLCAVLQSDVKTLPPIDPFQVDASFR